MAKTQRSGAAVAEPPPSVFDPANSATDPEGNPEGNAEENENSETSADQADRRRREHQRVGQKFAPHQEPTDFWEWLRSHSEAEWQQLECYLYRYAPVTDRLAGGHPCKYVTKYGQGVDLELVKREHGSGKYQMRVNQLSVGPGGKPLSKTIKTLVFEIEDQNFPPKVPPGEWMDDPRNKRWAWGKAPEGGAAQAGTSGAQANGLAGAAELFKVVLDAVGRLRPDIPKDDQKSVTAAIVDAMAKSQEQTFALFRDRERPQTWTPEQLLSIGKSLVEILRPPPAPEAASTAIVTMLQEQNKDLREEMRELRKELRGDSGLGGGILKAVREARLVEKLLKTDQEPADWKTVGMQLLGEHAPSLINVLAANRGASASRGASADGVPPQPPPRAIAGNPAGAPQAPGNDGQPTQDPQLAEAVNVIRSYGGYMLNAFVQNATGVDFALSVINLVGYPTYRRIANLGVERFMQAIQLEPQFAQQFEGLEQQLIEFIQDFVAGPEAAEGEDDLALPANAPEPKRTAGPRPVPKKAKAAAAAEQQVPGP